MRICVCVSLCVTVCEDLCVCMLALYFKFRMEFYEETLNDSCCRHRAAKFVNFFSQPLSKIISQQMFLWRKKRDKRCFKFQLSLKTSFNSLPARMVPTAIHLPSSHTPAAPPTRCVGERFNFFTFANSSDFN